MSTKIAFFAPFPPKQTGVAAYSRTLLSAMRPLAAITPFDFDHPGPESAESDLVDCGREPWRLCELSSFDATIFSLGNNPFFHLSIFRAVREFPGLILLHDAVLYYLYAGLPAGGFYREFCANYGLDRTPEIAAIHEASLNRDPLRYPHPERYPFLAGTARAADGIIVHSRFAADLLRAAAPEANIYRIPLVVEPVEMSPERHTRAGQCRSAVTHRPGQVLFGSFGFLGASKRLQSVARALGELKDEIDFSFVIVGEGPDPLPDFAAAGIADRVSWQRYVSEADFDAWLEATDVVINLRFPSMGESSATLGRAMSLARPCVVTNYGSFTELPDNTVWKISHEEAEHAELLVALRTLADNASRREEIGRHAQNHVRRVQSPGNVAHELLEVVRDHQRRKADRILRTQAALTPVNSAGATALRSALRVALPPHLQSLLPEQSRPSLLPEPIPLALTAEQVTWAFRILLEREPGREEISQLRAQVPTLEALKRIILGSEEYRRLSSTSP